MIIDGQEAGGQILRTALGLSAIIQKPIKVINIRGAREKPGLKAQHLQGIYAMEKLCDAEVKGAELGSKEIEFIPNKINEKELNVEIKTAGSISLLCAKYHTAYGIISGPSLARKSTAGWKPSP